MKNSPAASHRHFAATFLETFIVDGNGKYVSFVRTLWADKGRGSSYPESRPQVNQLKAGAVGSTPSSTAFDL
jgi:hypothetical protein